MRTSRRRCPDRYRRHFLAIEVFLAISATVLLAVWATWWGGWSVLAGFLKDNRPAFYGAVASLAGSLLGFVIAAFAIVLSSIGSVRLAAITRHSVHMRTLFRVFTAATVALGMTTAVGLTALLADREQDQRPVLFYLCFGGILVSTVTLGRTVWILHEIVSILSQPPKARPGNQ